MASKTTTPQEISLVITEFCLDIAPKAIPNFVEGTLTRKVNLMNASIMLMLLFKSMEDIAF